MEWAAFSCPLYVPVSYYDNPCIHRCESACLLLPLAHTSCIHELDMDLRLQTIFPLGTALLHEQSDSLVPSLQTEDLHR